MSCTKVDEDGTRYEEIAQCTGHCCERFHLPLSPEEIAYAWEFNAGNYSQEYYDVVFPMLIWLEKSALHPSGEIMGDGSDQYKAHYYTCRHFDRETRQCLIYDRRPKMCAEYPYGKEGEPCQFKGCTMKLRAIPPNEEEPMTLRKYRRSKKTNTKFPRGRTGEAKKTGHGARLPLMRSEQRADAKRNEPAGRR